MRQCQCDYMLDKTKLINIIGAENTKLLIKESENRNKAAGCAQKRNGNWYVIDCKVVFYCRAVDQKCHREEKIFYPYTGHAFEIQYS